MTPLLTASASNPSLITVAIVGALLLAAGYVIECAVYPFAPCRHCTGGKKRSPFSTGWRDCTHCGGRGRTVRLGRRLWAAVGDLNDRGRH